MNNGWGGQQPGGQGPQWGGQPQWGPQQGLPGAAPQPGPQFQQPMPAGSYQPPQQPYQPQGQPAGPAPSGGGKGMKVALVGGSVLLAATLVVAGVYGVTALGGGASPSPTASATTTRPVATGSADPSGAPSAGAVTDSPSGSGMMISLEGSLSSFASVTSDLAFVATDSEIAMLDLRAGEVLWDAPSQVARVSSDYVAAGEEEQKTVLEQSDGVMRLRSITTGEVLTEGAAAGWAIHCMDEIVVVESDRTLAYALTDLSTPLHTQVNGATWPTDGIVVCWRFTPDFAFGFNHPIFELLHAIKGDQENLVGRGMSGVDLMVLFHEDDVYVQNAQSEATLPIRGVFDGARSDRYAALLGTDGVTAVDLATLEIAWDGLGVGEYVRLDYGDGQLYAFGERNAYTIDIEVGVSTPIGVTSTPASWILDYRGGVCGIEGGQAAAPGGFYEAADGLSISCFNTSGEPTWQYSVEGPARLAEQDGAIALENNGQVHVFR